MRVMSLDIGQKRIGVAISDAGAKVASPLAILDAARVRGDSRELLRLIGDYEVELIVVGLPLSLNGAEGRQAAHVRSVAQKLASRLQVPIEYFDERYSSAEAKRLLSSGGVTEREQRGRVDSLAATLFLQNYLDLRRESGAEGTELPSQ